MTLITFYKSQVINILKPNVWMELFRDLLVLVDHLDQPWVLLFLMQISVSDNLGLILMFHACGGKCQGKLCLVEMDDLYFPENINKLIDLWQRQDDLVGEQTETRWE